MEESKRKKTFGSMEKRWRDLVQAEGKENEKNREERRVEEERG
ncbi:hypothetical protein SLEP1_g28854 [Rubroshorea leprosula]|uniref:Uncharacterized protein n=1 Tax=Rubroshorea leprosula TaxID=152421 RepID=A0AAV5K4N5_9ROSI|nr:hypothetical protein SLEP1_g28854 [Rubroshorea leprosula]